MARFGMSKRTLSRFFLLSHDLTDYAVCKCNSCPSYIILGRDASAGWHIVLTRCRLSDMVVIMASILIAYTYGCQTQTSYSGVKTRLNLVSGKKWPWNKFSMPKRFVSYLAVFHNHLTSHNGHDRPAPQLPTIVNGIIRVRLQQVRSNSLFKIQVNYRQVCI